MSKWGIFGGLAILLAIVCLFPSSGWAVNCKCEKAGDLQSCISAYFGQTWTTFTIEGPATCYENLTIVTEGVQLSADTSKGAVTISAEDSKKPVISIISSGWSGISGFTIEGGTYGVVFGCSHGFIVNSTIKNNSIAGIWAAGTADASIGITSPDAQGVSPNDIFGNPVGILVSNASSALIVGNSIRNGSVAGIMVDRVSQAEVSGNSIDGCVNAVKVSGNSGVNLSDSIIPLFGPLNQTTMSPSAINSGAPIACTMGGYVSGYQGALAGLKANSFDNTCINALKTNSSPLVGTWTVLSSKNLSNPPSSLIFYPCGTGTDNSGSGWLWTLTGNTLTMTTAGGKVMQGTLTWASSAHIQGTWEFTDPGVKGECSMTIRFVPISS
jgi:hypothetical protein